MTWKVSFFWKSVIIFVCLAVWTNCAILTDNSCSINLEVGRCLLQIHNNTLYHSMFQWCILQKKSREMMIPSCKDKCAQIAMIKSTWFRQSLVSIKYFPKNSNIDTKTHTSRETIIGIDYKMTWNIFNHGQVLSEKKNRFGEISKVMLFIFFCCPSTSNWLIQCAHLFR